MHKDLNYSISLIRDFYKLRLHKGGGGQIKAILCKVFGCEVYDMEGDSVKKYCNYANAIYVHSLKEFLLPCGPWMDSSGIWKAWWFSPRIHQRRVQNIDLAYRIDLMASIETPLRPVRPTHFINH